MKLISGAKGDSTPKQRTPVEEANTLQSRAIARFIDLIGEGEIEGLVNGEQSIFFDNVPIRDSSNNYNFDGLEIEFKPGVPDHITNREYPVTESEKSVQIKLEHAVPVIRTVSYTDVDDLNLTFTIPSLLEVNSSTGDVKKTTVTWDIDIKPDGGSWTHVKRLSKYGKCGSAYQTDYRIKRLDVNYGAGPWEVRCTRVTADSSSSNLQNDVHWASITEIINRELTYPDSALCYIELNSQQFGSKIPTRGFEVYGQKIWLPSNYDPNMKNPTHATTYDGVWDGQLTTYAYSNNPAWIYYDLLNNERYGLGLEAEYIDKWALYSIGQYCDELVPDNEGSFERRFTFNGVLQSRQDAVNVLSMLASSFRAMPFWGGGEASLSQDSPKDPVKLVTAANVINGDFMYRGSSIKHRNTVANVSWNDPDDFYRLKVEAVDDNEGMQRFGYRPIDTVAYGCTSRGQAYRYGRWLLYTAQNETETLTYRASWDHADVFPGDIIEVLDPHFADKRTGGRVASTDYGADTLTIDSAIILESGQTYTIQYIKPDGTLSDDKDILNPSDGLEHSVLTISGYDNPADVPQDNAVWIITASNLEPRQFRVVSNVEAEPNIYEITCTMYDPNKYAEVEDGKQFDPAPITKVPDANTPIEAPTNLNAEEYTYEDTENSAAADRKFGVILSWTHTRDTRFHQYEVQWKRSTGSYSDNETLITTDTEIDIKPIESGTYNFRIQATGLVQESVWVTLSEFVVYADPDVPNNITGLKVILGDDDSTFNGKDCNIEWDEMVLSTDTTSAAIYDSTAPVSAAPFDSTLTKVKDYQIEVLKTDDTHLRYAWTTDNTWIYTIGMNQDDNGTAIRTFKFKVWARDIYDQLSNDAATLVVNNPAPDMSGLDPTVEAIYAGLKVDWSNITPTDNDMAGFRVYLDENNPPTTKVAEVGANTNYWVEPSLTAETTYRVQVEPYDDFGVGVKSNVANGEPLKIPLDDVETELVGRLRITDSYDNTASDFTFLYDTLTGASDPYGLYQSGDWIKVGFPTEQLVDRVSVWANLSSLNCYFSTSDDQGASWRYFGANSAGDHTLDAEGRLTEYGSQGAAAAAYWTADAGAYNLDLALYPNGLSMTDCRIHFLTNNIELTELRFTDQVIAEWIVARELSAISADVGVLTAGLIQSGDLSQTQGMLIDLDNDEMILGGTVDRDIVLDGSTATIAVTDNGLISLGDSGRLTVGENGLISLGEGGILTAGDQNVIINTGGSDNHGSIVVAEDGGPDTGSYCELTDGDIRFEYWDETNQEHISYSNLTRIETGVAENDSTVEIPGIFKDAPEIMVSPNSIQTYNLRYRTQSQKIRFEVADLTQFEKFRWSFRPKAVLELSAGSAGATAVNQNTTINAAGSGNSSTVTGMLANTRRIIVSFGVTAIYRGNRYLYACNFTATLYVKVGGSWKTWVRPFRPVFGQTGGSWVIDTGFQPGDITAFYVNYRYDNSVVRTSYFSQYVKHEYFAGNISIKQYSSDQSEAAVVEPGQLNWMAVGR